MTAGRRTIDVCLRLLGLLAALVAVLSAAFGVILAWYCFGAAFRGDLETAGHGMAATMACGLLCVLSVDFVHRTETWWRSNQTKALREVQW